MFAVICEKQAFLRTEKMFNSIKRLEEDNSILKRNQQANG